MPPQQADQGTIRCFCGRVGDPTGLPLLITNGHPRYKAMTSLLSRIKRKKKRKSNFKAFFIPVRCIQITQAEGNTAGCSSHTKIKEKASKKAPARPLHILLRHLHMWGPWPIIYWITSWNTSFSLCLITSRRAPRTDRSAILVCGKISGLNN